MLFINMIWDSGSWFDKLTMRESGDATLIAKIAAKQGAELDSLSSPLSLMVSLSNHEPRTTIPLGMINTPRFA